MQREHKACKNLVPNRPARLRHRTAVACLVYETEGPRPTDVEGPRPWARQSEGVRVIGGSGEENDVGAAHQALRRHEAHAAVPGWNTTVNSTQFGLPVTANAMRSAQVSIRVRF